MKPLHKKISLYKRKRVLVDRDTENGRMHILYNGGYFGDPWFFGEMRKDFLMT